MIQAQQRSLRKHCGYTREHQQELSETAEGKKEEIAEERMGKNRYPVDQNEEKVKRRLERRQSTLTRFVPCFD